MDRCPILLVVGYFSSKHIGVSSPCTPSGWGVCACPYCLRSLARRVKSVLQRAATLACRRYLLCLEVRHPQVSRPLMVIATHHLNGSSDGPWAVPSGHRRDGATAKALTGGRLGSFWHLALAHLGRCPRQFSEGPANALYGRITAQRTPAVPKNWAKRILLAPSDGMKTKKEKVAVNTRLFSVAFAAVCSSACLLVRLGQPHRSPTLFRPPDLPSLSQQASFGIGCFATLFNGSACRRLSSTIPWAVPEQLTAFGFLHRPHLSAEVFISSVLSTP